MDLHRRIDWIPELLSNQTALALPLGFWLFSSNLCSNKGCRENKQRERIKKTIVHPRLVFKPSRGCLSVQLWTEQKLYSTQLTCSATLAGHCLKAQPFLELLAGDITRGVTCCHPCCFFIKECRPKTEFFWPQVQVYRASWNIRFTCPGLTHKETLALVQKLPAASHNMEKHIAFSHLFFGWIDDTIRIVGEILGWPSLRSLRSFGNSQETVATVTSNVFHVFAFAILGHKNSFNLFKDEAAILTYRLQCSPWDLDLRVFHSPTATCTCQREAQRLSATLA